MQRSDYGYRGLSYAQYESIVFSAEMNGTPSPMHGDANYSALLSESLSANVDPRLLLAWTLWEDHDGTDPNGGVALAKVYNFAGIKWAGQADAFDSGILCPPNEGGTYAGFFNLGGFARELYRTLNNEYCGPYFRAGDLLNAASVYIRGYPNSGSGQTRVDSLLRYQRLYPAQGDARMVTGKDVAAEALKWEGYTDRGLYDPSNGHGTPFMWCMAYCESMAEHAGVLRTRYTTALAFLNDPNIETHNTWPAPAGAFVLYGRNIDPAGHVQVSLGDGRVIGTTVAGIRVDPIWAGAAGWQWYPGVSPDAPVAIPDAFYVDGNPHGHIPVKDVFWGRWDALNTMGTPLDHPGAVNPAGLAMPTIGYPTAPEYVTATGRRIQRFERAALATSNGDAPWDVVSLLLSEIPA